MAQKNTTAYIILGLLNHEDLSGYDLKKHIDLAISQFWDVGYGQLYPTLKALEKEGSITGKPVLSDKGPSRILYSITANGRKKLLEWLLQPEEKEYVRYEILLKLYFGSMSGTESHIKRIEGFKEQHNAGLKQLQFFKSNLERVFDENPDHFYYFLTVLFGEHMYKAYMEWADEAIQFIQNNIQPLEHRKEDTLETPENP